MDEGCFLSLWIYVMQPFSLPPISSVVWVIRLSHKQLLSGTERIFYLNWFLIRNIKRGFLCRLVFVSLFKLEIIIWLMICDSIGSIIDLMSYQSYSCIIWQKLKWTTKKPRGRQQRTQKKIIIGVPWCWPLSPLWWILVFLFWCVQVRG